jgi:membrane protein CcdC involved in cytochrome C biogenesis
MQTVTVLASIAGAAAVLAWRVRETRRPVTAVNLLAPPLGMSTGFLMFVVPATRVPLSWALGAFAVGALLFSYPLLHTSRLTRQGDTISLQRSPAFLWILLGLFAVRFALRSYVEQYVSVLQTGALFFVLAFGMIVPWRVALYARFRRLQREPSAGGWGRSPHRPEP